MSLLSLPNISTDNFYKFITVLGLTTFCYCCYMIPVQFATNRETEINTVEKRIELQTEFNNLNNEEKFLKISLAISNKLETEVIDSICKGFENLTFNDKYKSIIISNDFIKLQKNINKKIYLSDLINLYKTKKEDSQLYSDFTIPFLAITLLISLICIFLGFYNWFYKHQKLINKKLQFEYLNYEYIYEICQSCAKNFRIDTIRPKEKDGSICLKYCSNCYENGNFKDSNISFEEMKEKIQREHPFKNKLSKWFRTFDLSRVSRWRKKN